VDNTEFIISSIYGPNSNDFTFFESLSKFFQENNSTPIICGGDWNTTFSTGGVNDNIDIFNMCNPPSMIRSGWLSDLCEQFKLTDPFRALHFNKIDFSFVPRTGSRNRSRIDFFLISDILLSICSKCNISPSLDTELFDHKHINLEFNSTKRQTRHFIKPFIFNHPCFSAVVDIAVAECIYITRIGRIRS
jgi:exonuclease III